MGLRLARLIVLLLGLTLCAARAEAALPTPPPKGSVAGVPISALPAAEPAEPTFSPVIKLTEYQKRWVEDRSRFKIGLWGRQTGKSFATSLEAVLDCYGHSGARWVFLSAGERQSKELMAAAAMHARAIGLAITELEGIFKAEDGSEYKQLEILLPNGSRIIGLPANPNTARGHSAHILLDEFAFHQNSRAIWRALFPTVTRGYKIRIVSTPQGKANKFYELWTAKTLQLFDGLDHSYVGARGGWSKHRITIDQAVLMGLTLLDDEAKPCAPEDLRLALNDDEAWHQEYLVEFLDETTAFLSYDLIESVEDGQVETSPPWAQKLLDLAVAHHAETKHLESPPAFDASETLGGVLFEGDLYLGFDIARRRDLSILWADEVRSGDAVAITRAVINLAKQPFGVQERVLHGLLGLSRTRRACIDKTGMGEQLAERAAERWPSKVEGIDFTVANKEALATGIRKAFEDRRDRIPADQQIRQSLHAVKKIETATGHFRFDADRTEQIGHADHSWAKALAVEARSKPAGPIEHQTTGHKRDFTRMEGYLG